MNPMLSDDDDNGSALGMDLLINKKRYGSTEGGSQRSFDLDAKGMTDDDGDGMTDTEPDIGGNNSPRGGGAGKMRRNRKSYEEDADGSSSLGSASTDIVASKPMRQEDALNAKRELLYQFSRLEKKGVHVPKHYTMASDLEEMRADWDRLKRDVEVDASIRFQRRMLMACVSGVEFMNNRFDPFDVHLDGWSETVQDGINEYDDIFEELHDKYRGKVKMAPELRLMFTLGGSAVWFHMSHSMFRSTMPGIDQIFKQNPELKRQFMSATMKTMGQENSPNPPKEGAVGGRGGGGGGGGLFGSLGNMVGGLFGGGGRGQNLPPAPPTPGRQPSRPPQRPNMRGPSDVDDILSEMNNDERFSEMNDVLEVFSNASSDDGLGSLADFGADAETSVPHRGRGGGRAPAQRGRAPARRRTLDLD